MTDTVIKVEQLVRVRFTVIDEKYRLDDALNLTAEQYAQLKPEEIEQRVQERFAAHVQRMENPPPAPEPTKEELEQEAAAIDEQRAALDVRAEEIQSALAEAVSAEISPVEGVTKNGG